MLPIWQRKPFSTQDIEKEQKLLTCLLLSYVFSIHIFPRYWAGKEEKNLDFPICGKFICIGFYVGCVLHKIGMFWFSSDFIQLCSYTKGRQSLRKQTKPKARAIKSRKGESRGKDPEPINILCGFQVYCCQLKYGYFEKRFPIASLCRLGNWN